ncbi:hypothetical protein OKW96_20800 [Sphingobacterium sp. KU25419]|nr:hypothetical protein OKW96_20800 [Sphingobacterium sp. KU25419]
MLEELSTPNQVLAEIDTVGTAISFLKNNTVDLIFSDIELLDGNAFDIYREVISIAPLFLLQLMISSGWTHLTLTVSHIY